MSQTRQTVSVTQGHVQDLNWSQVDLPVQWNSDDDADCCSNILQGTQYFLDSSSSRAKSTLGQLFSYAAEQMSHHRLWVFAVAIYGSYARFFRFDRSSIVISAPVKYMENSRIFLEFFWRYARLDAVTRGYDPTVSPASSPECALFDAKIKEYLERAERRRLRKYPGVEDLTNDQYVTSKVRVDDRDGGVSYWIVRKPLAQPHLLLPCGKNTRGYIAVEAPDLDASGLPLGDENEAMNKEDRCELYWLKDSWRLEECEAEADIYHDLKKAKVSHVPVVKCAGDVLQGENEDGDVDEDEDGAEEEEDVVEDEHDECDDGGEDEAEDGIDREVQQTTNQKWLSHPGARTIWKGVTGRIQPCIHHRVVQEVVYPLSCVQSARELVRATRDVLETVIEAYYNANLLHLDISKGNVMLTEKFTDGQDESGVLNDWDISHFVGLGTRHRSGTWPFMSIQLLEDPKKTA
ncbi:unnamed protein product [Somion occarium]|uniref:Fungal-type protein kinase domain-containing protein n=1 Tax=Somion occarium TaxID=3059160 RepID=A0ABP1DTN7_9APHY